MESSFTIRKATPEDFAALGEAHVASIREIAPAYYTADIVADWGQDRDPSAYQKSMDEGEIFWIAVPDKDPSRVVGFASYRFEDKQHKLQAIYVRGTKARKGVGTALLKVVEDHARSQGATDIHLRGALSAEDFYRRHGFEEVGRIKHEMDSGFLVDCVNMKKDLPSTPKSCKQ